MANYIFIYIYSYYCVFKQYVRRTSRRYEVNAYKANGEMRLDAHMPRVAGIMNLLHKRSETKGKRRDCREITERTRDSGEL